MKFDLVLDVPRPNDLLVSYGDVQIVVDPASTVYLDEGMKVEYLESKKKYKILSPNQVLPQLYSL